MACVRHLLLAVLFAAMFAAGPARAQAENELARAVKATFLYKFVPFVEWPDAAFSSATSPVDICVVGDDAFGRLVARAAAGQQVGRRAIAVRLLPKVGPDSACHVMYVGPYGDDSIATNLARVRGQPVLTVTDEINGDIKGIVHFVIRDGRVRFEIDNRRAGERGLTINPKLLELAVGMMR